MLERRSEKSDNVLLARAAEGDQQAIEALMIRYKNLVRSKAASMFMAGADSEDVIQEGMIGLFKAIQDFKPEFRVPFPAFASYCIASQITDAVRRASRQKHRPLNDSLSLQTLVKADDAGDNRFLEVFIGDSGPNPEEILLDRERVVDLQKFFLNHLSRLEQQTVLLFMQKLRYQQIADCLGCTTKQVDNALSRARRKFSAYRQDKSYDGMMVQKKTEGDR
ncbi:MAG: sigma-70 family RNA polymerase sigma factor [Saccharofermentanales bacterium]|jgi:RNA polymerase sporulation-specific sigma factor|nr:sigma-70 family RNA polymerase sigma factor [Clostridiaceae bacterium]